MRSARSLALGLAMVALGLVSGCASSPAAPAITAGAKEGKTVELPEMVVSHLSDPELEAEFERARALLLRERYREAAPIFDKLVRLAPDGETAPPSLYDGALAHEGAAERKEAIERYEQLLKRFPDHPVSRGAMLRLTHLEGYLERWPDLVASADKLLQLKDLTVIEAIDARGAKALGLVEQDRIDEAARELGAGRDLVEQHRLGESGPPPLELAQLAFALGEVRRKKSEKVTFSPMPPDFAEALEQRCQGLLDAQSAYTDAMRSFDAHWSAMAGYRVGQLYQALHRDVMQIPPVKADTLKKKQLFEGAMRLRYRVLLEKGLKMMEGTVRLGKRTGEDSPWVHRAEEAQKDIELSLEDEKAALAKLPFTEAELQAALDLLKTGGNAKAAAKRSP